jgi:hypothetical protein
MDSRRSTIGETLRRARVSRGLSLTDVEVAIRARARYLQALEADDFAALPPTAYTRVLIREYARFLGLDPAVVLDMALPMRPEDRNPIRPAMAPLEKPAVISWRAVLTVAVLALCAGLFLYLYAQYNSFAQSVEPARAPTPSRVISAAVTPIPPFPTETLPPTLTPVPTATQVTGLLVEARLLAPTWVQVWTDGRPVLAEILPAGTSRAFAADRSIRMRVGNASAVDVTFNGTPQGKLGESAQAVDATWDF